LDWDSRLDQIGVIFKPATPTPGAPYWRLIYARWYNEEEARGNVNIWFDPLDEEGQRAVGTAMRVVDGGSYDVIAEPKPGEEWAGSFRMQGYLGSYDAWIAEGDLPSDAVLEMGLGVPEHPGWLIHTSFGLKWQRAIAP